MHGVVGDLLLLHRAEGTKSHMECNVSDLYTHLPDLLQQLRCEMQSRSGGGGRAVHLGVDGLIALPILQFLLDVGRQRHLAQPIQHLQKNTLVEKPHPPVAVRQLLRDLRRQLAVAEGHPCALAQLLARTDKAFPHVVAPVDEQQDLTGAAARYAVSQQAGGQHSGIVEDQAVAGMQILRQVEEMPVLRGAGGLIQHQQPGGVPLCDRGLCDQLRRQVKIEIMGLHLYISHFLK